MSFALTALGDLRVADGASLCIAYQCLKYKTHSSIILNRFETLNGRLLTLMAAPTPVAAAPAPAEEQQAEEGDVSMADVSMTVAREGTPAPETPGGGAKKGGNAPGGGTGGGVSKKKKKGKR